MTNMNTWFFFSKKIKQTHISWMWQTIIFFFVYDHWSINNTRALLFLCVCGKRKIIIINKSNQSEKQKFTKGIPIWMHTFVKWLMIVVINDDDWDISWSGDCLTCVYFLWLLFFFWAIKWPLDFMNSTSQNRHCKLFVMLKKNW